MPGIQAHAARRCRDGETGRGHYSLLPRLTAIAATAQEVVGEAGGWLFDQALAGWDVTIITADHPDPRPLLVLGARSRDVAILAAHPLSGRCLTALAVSGQAYEGDPEVRKLALAAARAGADIRAWGQCPPDLRAGAELASHSLSLAAQAFKAQALRALGAPGPVGPAEAFYRGLRPQVMHEAMQSA